VAKSDNSPATRPRRVRIAVLGYEGCSAWITAGVLELFAIANLPPRRGSRRPTRFECVTISATGRAVHASHGVRLPSVAPGRGYDALITPPLWSATIAEFGRRVDAVQRLAPLLRRLASTTKIMASACSGAVLLAQAGLLAEHRATTCWWLADWFGRRFPDVRLDARKLVVIDRGRWTAAAGTAYVHLCLELVKEFAGAEAAAATARLALVEPRRGSQSPFLGGGLPAGEVDGTMRRAARLIEDRLAAELSIPDVAKQLHTTERTLHRRFRDAFGVPPLVYLQSRRIALAKRLLEASDGTLEHVVERCGYTDVSSFRKLFAREVGMTPREYRLRFQR
jgi:transcriptional regulator GlxA family with amidase domain